MKLFLDTEWADTFASELVSLALVGDGLEFYAERQPLPEQCTDFARTVVYPRLFGGQWALEDAPFAQHLREFIALATEQDNGRPPTIGFDFWADKSLFEYACGGFEGDGVHPPLVDWFDLKQLEPHYSRGVEAYFRDNPPEAERRHHALVDAKAAQAGYRAAMKARSEMQ